MPIIRDARGRRALLLQNWRSLASPGIFVFLLLFTDMSGYIPGAVAGIISSNSNDHVPKDGKRAKTTSKLQALFSAPEPQPSVKSPKKEESISQVNRKRTQSTSSESSPIKKKKHNNSTDNISESETVEQKPVGRTEQRENKKKKKKDPEKEKRTVFVGNLPNKTTKKHLTTLFKKYGEIESVRFRSAAPADLKLPKKAVMNMKTFHPELKSMNGYVVFKENSSAKEALTCNGDDYEGNSLRVDLLIASKKHDNERSVFVGNLPFAVQDDDVRTHFKDCGQIKNVRVIRDGKTGLGKGFGYILFEDKDGVSFALKLNGSTLQKRQLRVTKSVGGDENGKKKKKEDSTKARTPSSPVKGQKDDKKKSFSRNMPSNVKLTAYQGIKAQKMEKIKKRIKHKKSLKKKKDNSAPVINQGDSRSTDAKKKANTLSNNPKNKNNPKKNKARDRIKKKMRKNKFSTKQ